MLVACASGGQLSLRDGLLEVGIGRKAFLAEWGRPDRTLSILSEQALADRWGTPVDLIKAADRDEAPELWIYDRYGTELLFIKGDLAAWKTNRTPEQLRQIPKFR